MPCTVSDPLWELCLDGLRLDAGGIRNELALRCAGEVLERVLRQHTPPHPFAQRTRPQPARTLQGSCT